MEKQRTIKVAYVGATPAYYFIPFLRLLAGEKRIALTVHWLSDESVREYYEKDLRAMMCTEPGLLSGYRYKFEKNLIGKESYQEGFWGLNSIGPVISILKGEYDVVIVHGWQYITNIMVIVAAVLKGTKICLRAETPLNQENTKNGYKKYIRYILLKLLFRLIDRFLYIGKQNFNFYRSFGVKNNALFFTPYCVNNEAMEEAIERGRKLTYKTLEKYTLDVNKRKLLFIGKLQAKKRPDFLIEAFRRLNPNLNIELIIVGHGELYNSLQTLAKGTQDIKLLGYRNQSEIAEILAIAHAFILPSGDGETWGLVLNEALNAGLPLIVSDRVGSCDDLVTEKNGITFTLDNIFELTAAIEWIFVDEERRISLGVESKKLTSIYSPENVKKGIIAAINSIYDEL